TAEAGSPRNRRSPGVGNGGIATEASRSVSHPVRDRSRSYEQRLHEPVLLPRTPPAKQAPPGTPGGGESGGSAEGLGGHAKRRIRGRNPAVNGGLEEHLLQLLDRDTVVEGRAEVQPELLFTVQRDQQGHGDAAPRAAIESWSRPDLAPRVA